MGFYALSYADVSLSSVAPILNAKRGVSPEMAVLLSVYFGTSDSYWINLQTHYDLQIAKERVRKKAARIIPQGRSYKTLINGLLRRATTRSGHKERGD